MSTGSFRGHLLSFTLCMGVAFAWLAFLVGQGGGLPSFGENAYRARALVPTAASITPGARVTMAGVPVGKVKQVKRAGMGARIGIEFDDDSVTPIPADSSIEIRQHTPVGENYVAIIRGKSSRMLPSDGVLPVSQSREYVDVDRVLSVLRGQTRERARQTLQSLGGALHGRGDKLNQLVGNGSSAINGIARLVEVLHRDRGATARLVQQLGDVTAAVGARGEAIHTIAQRGLTGLGAIRDRDAALGATLRALPQTLSRLHELAGTVRSASGRAAPVVESLSAAVREVRPTVRNLRPAAQQGRGVIADLGAAAPGLRRTLSRLSALSTPLSSALPQIGNTMCQLNPMVRYIKPRAYQTLSILIGLSSSSNSYDATGHLIRLAPIMNDNSLAGQSDAFEKAGQKLLHSGLFGSMTALSFNPYPAPGQLGTERATNGGPIGPSEVPKTGFKYPHVEADC